MRSSDSESTARVLVFDPDAKGRAQLAGRLQKARCAVMPADNALTALTRIETRDIELVILALHDRDERDPEAVAGLKAADSFTQVM